MTDEKSSTRSTVIGTAVAAAVLCILIAAIITRGRWLHRTPLAKAQLTGSVLRQNKDPRKQSPIANAEVTATSGPFQVNSKSDSSGLFQLFLPPALRPRQSVTLTFKHDEYKPVEITRIPSDQLYIIRMDPIVPDRPGEPINPGTPKPLPVKDVRVRYTVKNQTTINVGSLAKQFDVVNTGNIPCGAHHPCSPDGKWRATANSYSLDAEEQNQFRNVRITCIAGPCSFTEVKPGDLSHPSRVIDISILNWSDTASFLVEAEVTRTVVADTTRRSYPTIIGQTMTFSLPATAEGPTVEANLNGEEIIFPLGPRLILSWATCSVEVLPGQNKTYRCELKSGYQFPQ